MNNQPTILVKKADGASVRMTMDELQAYKKSQTASSAPPASVSVASVKPVQPPIQPPSPQSPFPKTYKKPLPPKDEDEIKEKWEAEDHKSLLDDSSVKEKALVVKPVGAALPANTTPVRNIFVDEAKYKAVKFDKPKIEAKPASQPISYKPEAKSYNEKPLIQDVKPPNIDKQSMGPVDELANFSLADFRRLEINSKAAGIKLLEKFEILKQDSFLLFIEGVKVWYNSPIYKQYQDVLYQSLAHGKSVNEILASGNAQKDLKLEEFKAIISVNEAIN